jgi:hypothetical protein
MASGGEKTRFGEKHRTEVTEVTEGGIEVGENIHASDSMACWRETTRFGEKHRTEVTEVTEGGIEFGENIHTTDSMACCGKRRERGKSIGRAGISH